MRSICVIYIVIFLFIFCLSTYAKNVAKVMVLYAALPLPWKGKEIVSDRPSTKEGERSPDRLHDKEALIDYMTKKTKIAHKL